MTDTITWLHLSDLHFCQYRTGWDASRVLSTLEEDLKVMQQHHGLQPDFIFFTGDLVYGQLGDRSAENIAEQFDGAARFFDRVRRSFQTEIPIENFFVVPGNHDVNRDYITEDQVSWLERQTDESKIISLISGNTLQWKRYIERLVHYRNFLERYLPHLLCDSDRLIYSITRRISAHTIRIAGLNSAWSSSRDNEKAKLWMAARWQIEHLRCSSSEADLSIVLSHHPSNWLVEYEDPHFARHIERDFDFSLHGHEHQAWLIQSGEHIRIAAGACYDRSDKPNGYNFVRLNLSTGNGELWLRKYHSIGGGWIPEIVPSKTTNDGLWTFTTYKKPEASLADHSYHVGTSTTPVFRPYGSDLKPVVEAWVGREPELKALEATDSGIVVVTGIGGQGKSALVSKYLETWLQNNPDGFWDWRDCREESDRFLTQLVAMMEHLTQGDLRVDLSNVEAKVVVRHWFELVGRHKGFIVLDNVDSYVSQDEEKFKLALGIFVQEALRVGHKCLIFITCRPRVYYPSPRFLEIPLRGIELEEAIELFRLRKVQLNEINRSAVEEIWSRTEGHPLWLNLIAIQMFRSPLATPKILEELRKGVDDRTRTRTMFRALWQGLNDRQKSVLRCMAEISYPETKDSIRNFVNRLIKSPNQFNRAFEALKSMSLIVERQSTDGENRFDLHPLVRSFVKTEYARPKERLPYIETILGFLIQLFMDSGGPREKASFEELQRWTTKAELELVSGNMAAALKTLASTNDQLIARAFHEEFFRVAKLILESASWESVEIQDLPAFHKIVRSTICALVEHGREKEAREYLERYETISLERTVGRLQFCAVAAYVEWFVGNFEKAIVKGREGVQLKEEFEIDTVEDTSNTLALALRDNGDFDEAMELFAPGLKVEEIINENHLTSDRGPTFYGNVGRCLQFKGEYKGALACYVKSFLLLESASSATDMLNRGYASFWIGETLENLGDHTKSYFFYRRAVSIWSKRSPLRLASVIERLDRLLASVQTSFQNISDDEIELYCPNLVDDWQTKLTKEGLNFRL